MKITTDMTRLLYAAISLTVLLSCSKSRDIVQMTDLTNGSETILATAKDFVMAGMAKTVITQSGSDAPAFAWKEGDIIGIIPMNNETVQSNYKVSELSSNPKNATFDGGVWALKEGKEYAAYYPFKKEALVSYESIEFSFLGQTQSANNSLAHLGAYDYMYASAVVPQGGSAQFNFEHKICLVRLQLTVPKTDTYTKVVLESSENWFANTASLKLSEGTMLATETVKSAFINLNNIAITAGSRLTVWIATLPTSALSGQTLSIKLIGNMNTCTGEITGIAPLIEGIAYSYAATLSSEDQVMEYVDLGLPSGLKWATCNLGAKSPEEFGDIYAWGETETKSEYSLDTYKFYKSEIIIEGDFEKRYAGYTKYVKDTKPTNDGFRGFYDNKTRLDLEDDAAHVKLGGNWRMPTVSEIDELLINCQSEWVIYKGVEGVKFTGKKVGYTDKWIFLPAKEYSAQCWSSSLETTSRAYLGDFQEYWIHRDNGIRYRGKPVRPVFY